MKKAGEKGLKRGRKPIPGILICSFTLERENAKLLKQWGGGNASAGLRWLMSVVKPMIQRKEITRPQRLPAP